MPQTQWEKKFTDNEDSELLFRSKEIQYWTGSFDFRIELGVLKTR